MKSNLSVAYNAKKMAGKKSKKDDIECMAEGGNVEHEIEMAEHPDCAGMVHTIMKKMYGGGPVSPTPRQPAPPDPQKTKDFKKGFGWDAEPTELEKGARKLGDYLFGDYGKADGGMIKKMASGGEIKQDFVDSDHEPDDFLSQDEYMDDYMGTPDEDPEIKKKKMLSGIMSSIAKENYGRSK